MKLKHALMLLAVCASSTYSAQILAAPALSFTGGSDTLNLSGTFIYGWEFDVFSDTTVSQLGYFDFENNGLAESHDIGIWNSVGDLLTSATIAAGTGAPLIDGFRYTDIFDITLSSGTGYVVGANNVDVDNMIADVDTLSTLPNIAWVESRFLETGGVLALPTDTIGRDAYFGPNFLTADAVTVPESRTLFLLALGLSICSATSITSVSLTTRFLTDFFFVCTVLRSPEIR